MAKPIPRLSPDEIQRVIATAWDDRPPYPQVLRQHGLLPGQLVQLLKRELTSNAYKVWVARTKAAPAARDAGRTSVFARTTAPKGAAKSLHRTPPK
jgi:uncharacterized protein (TIGR03643 family)